MTSLGERVWTDVPGGTVAVPVGSVEQHGPHLPLDTDTRIAAAVAEAVTETVGGGLVAPAIAYGASGEHEGFRGTVSIGLDVLTSVVIEYGRSAFRWAERVVFVNGHGGNGRALRDAVTLLRHEGRDAAWFPCAVPGADAHAGRTETSLLLHLDPRSVRVDVAEAGVTDPVSNLMDRLRVEGVAGVSPTGVLGDPTGANAAEGERLLTDLRHRFRMSVDRWTPDDRAVLR